MPPMTSAADGDAADKQPAGQRPGEQDERDSEAGAHQEGGQRQQRQAPDEQRVEAEMAAAMERGGEQNGVDPAGERGGDGDADMGEPGEQGQRDGDIDGDRDAGEPHRRPGVLAGEEAGREHLDQNEGRQAGGKGDERTGGGGGIGGIEAAALKEQRDDRMGHHHQRDRRRQRQRHGEFQRAVLGEIDEVATAGAQMARQVGQQDDADGDADDAERQLVDAIGVIEERHRTRRQRGDHGADDDVDLGDAAGEHAGKGKRRQAPQSRSQARPHQAEHHAVMRRRPDERGKLGDAADGGSPGEPDAGRRRIGKAEPEDGDQRGDQHDVQERRSEGGGGEAAAGVEHAAVERHQRNEGEIGEGDAGEHHRQVELLRIGRETGRQHEHEERHGDLDDRGDDKQRRQQAAQRLLSEAARFRLAVAFQRLGEQRHEGGIESALGEQTAEQVGEAEGDEEGIGDRPGAERGGDEHVAHEAEHAARCGGAADGDEVLQQRHGAKPARASSGAAAARPWRAHHRRRRAGAGGWTPRDCRSRSSHRGDRSRRRRRRRVRRRWRCGPN